MTTNEKIENEALSWIIKENEGIKENEKIAFKEFLNNIHHKKVYDKYKNLFFYCNNLKEKEKNNIKNDIKKEKISFNYNNILSSLAAAVIFIFISFSAFDYYEDLKSTYEISYQTKNTKKVNILLADNSIIDMDIKSTLNISYYKNKRLVDLIAGKALFSVTKDKKRPFIIRSGSTKIEVLGTKFEVINLNNIRTINVIEGLVRVSYLYKQKIKNLLILKKGESLSLNEEGKVLMIKGVDITNIATWKNDLIKFENISLKEALEEFARYNDKNIILEDYKVSQFKISGIFSIKNLDKFIVALPEIYPLKIKKEKDSIKIISIQQ